MSERANALILAKLQEGSTRDSATRMMRGVCANGACTKAAGARPAYKGSKPVSMCPGCRSSAIADGTHTDRPTRTESVAQQRKKRGLGGLERGDRVHHERRGRGTVHYVGSAPGMRGRPMASILWDNPVQQAAGPEPVFHGSGLARGLRKLKESELVAEGRVERGDSSLRHVETHTAGNRMAKVYRDKDWDEFRVKHYTDGKHHKQADYHTGDLDDAQATAKHWLNSKS